MKDLLIQDEKKECKHENVGECWKEHIHYRICLNCNKVLYACDTRIDLRDHPAYGT